MSWEGVAASTVTYNCVLDACANGGNPQRAAELFQEMKDRKVRFGVDGMGKGGGEGRSVSLVRCGAAILNVGGCQRVGEKG